MKNKQLVTKPYSKSCDSHCYLSPTSCRPTHILENIPYGIAHRIFKISSDGDTYSESKLEYTNYLKNRGYSESIILSSFEKAESLTRTDMIFKEKSKNSTPSSSSIPLVIYKIDDKIWKRCYIGSTAIGVSERWRNHKSHIRNNIKSCELSTHFSECNKHNFCSLLKDFNNELRKHLCITLIDTISFDADITNEDKRIQLLKNKEAFWQNQLKSLVTFGGLNKRDARKETKTKTYQRQN